MLGRGQKGVQRHKGYKTQAWRVSRKDKKERMLFVVTPALPCLHIVRDPRKTPPAMTANGRSLYGACGAIMTTA